MYIDKARRLVEDVHPSHFENPLQFLLLICDNLAFLYTVVDISHDGNQEVKH
jgi:hypothetical protein